MKTLIASLLLLVAAPALAWGQNGHRITGAIADRLAASDDHIHVMHRKGKEGLGAAYLAGFHWGLDVGYGVLVHDGATQYQVTVLDGKVVGFFSNTNAQRYVEAPFANYNPTIEPASARQTEAFEAAKAEIASVNPAATQGGIEYYAIFYPSEFEGTYPHVCIYAAPTISASPWAMGGSFGWQ